jgi:hypothetical protein
MALNWNVAAIAAREGEDYVWPIQPEPTEGRPIPHDRTPGERYLSGLTDCMIWATMFAQMGTITEANWQTFATRIRAWENMAGPISSRGTPLTADEVRRHIGLTTNVTTTTDAAFAKHLTKTAMQRAKDAMQREAAQ